MQFSLVSFTAQSWLNGNRKHHVQDVIDTVIAKIGGQHNSMVPGNFNKLLSRAIKDVNSKRTMKCGSVGCLPKWFRTPLISDVTPCHRSSGVDIHLLAMAAGPEVVPPPGSPTAPPLDIEAMKQAARAGGGSLQQVTPDDADVRQLNSRIDNSIAAAPAQEGERWKDFGYFLLPVFALMVLVFFRRGGAVALRA